VEAVRTQLRPLGSDAPTSTGRNHANRKRPGLRTASGHTPWQHLVEVSGRSITGPEENRHQYGTWDDDSWKVSFFALGAIWGCSFWFIKLGLRSFSPVDVAFGRLVLGAVTLVVVALVTRTSLPTIGQRGVISSYWRCF